MTLIRLWDDLRQTRVITALYDRITYLEDRNLLLKSQADVLAAQNDARCAQLETSRLLHAKELQKVDRLELLVEQLQYEVRSHQARRRKERAAMRMWITRHKTPQISAN